MTLGIKSGTSSSLPVLGGWGVTTYRGSWAAEPSRGLGVSGHREESQSLVLSTELGLIHPLSLLLALSHSGSLSISVSVSVTILLSVFFLLLCLSLCFYLPFLSLCVCSVAVSLFVLLCRS